MNCSRVIPPAPAEGGLGDAELGMAAVCGFVWAMAVAGSNDKPRSAAMTVERMFHDFRLMKIVRYVILRVDASRNVAHPPAGLHDVHIDSAKKPGLPRPLC
jgi:hypothetical protein